MEIPLRQGPRHSISKSGFSQRGAKPVGLSVKRVCTLPVRQS